MKYTLLALFITLFVSCNSDDGPIDYTEVNEQEIKDYIAEHDLDAARSDTGLYYVIDEIGSGAQPTPSSNVTVAYKGYFTGGGVFDPGNANGISFDLNRVIVGWTEGITYFNEGGNGLLLIPSHLGYGPNGRGTIPGGAVLIFDIDLISVN